MALIFLWDHFVPLGVAMGLLYVAPVLTTLWLRGRKPTLTVATVSSILIILDYIYSPSGEAIPWMVLTNRALSVSIVWAVTFLTLQRKDTEERLAQKQDELQTIFDSVPAMIWYKDKANRILNVNKGAAQSIGVPEHQIKGRLTDEFYPEDALKYHQDDLEVMQTGEPKLGIIEPYHVSADEKRWVQTDKIPYRDAQGNIVGVIVFAVDITDRIRAEEALHHANEQLEVRVTEALAKLKILRGLLPICASCKQIRDDQGYWDSVESYIQTHSEATFTHSICPNCIRKLYPDIDIAKLPKP